MTDQLVFRVRFVTLVTEKASFSAGQNFYRSLICVRERTEKLGI